MKTLVSDILNNLTKQELENLGVKKVTDYGKGRTRIHRDVIKEDGNPVSFCDVFMTDDFLDLVVVTDRESRELGYAQKAIERSLIWISCNPEIRLDRNIRWVTRSGNYQSVHLALRNGFILERKEKDESGAVWSHFLLF